MTVSGMGGYEVLTHKLADPNGKGKNGRIFYRCGHSSRFL